MKKGFLPRLLRDHLKALLSSNSAYEIAGEASDGVEALAMMGDVQPDIVITDIRMPRMDGLQLLREIQHRGYIVGRIALTDYGDFACTQRAMQQGVRNYLLKPIDASEVWKSLDAAVQEMNQEKRIMHQLRRGERERRELQLLRLLQNRPAESIPGSLFDCDRPGRLFIIEILGEDDGNDKELMEELQSDTSVIASVDETRIACYQWDCANPEEAARLLRDIFSAGDRQVTVAYGNELPSPGLIGKSYQDISRLLSSKWLLPQNTIIHTGMLPETEESNAGKSIQLWKHAALDEAIAQGNEEAVRHQVNSLFHILRNTACSEQMKRAMFTEELIHIMRSVSEKGGDAGQVLDQGISALELLKTYNISEMESWYCSVCVRVSQYLAAIRESRPKCVSDRIMAMFAQDPSGNYSLQKMARMFYMSLSYLEIQFKKERGQTLHAYLTAERLRLSKKALAETDAPVYEIAEQCGYQNLRSFFTAFKKSENCTPSEYRERIKNNEPVYLPQGHQCRRLDEPVPGSDRQPAGSSENLHP